MFTFFIYQFTILNNFYTTGVSDSPDDHPRVKVAHPIEPQGYVLPEHYQIAEKILENYNKGYIPKRIVDGAINVSFSMELYQIIQINEPQQYLLMNAWMAERWVDHLLGWDPQDFHNVTQIMIPYNQIWLPDTTLYNSLVMDEASTRRLLSVKLTTYGKDNGTLVELLYPTIYKQSCMLDLRFFPFDLQKCKLTFGSWTYDNTLIDYFPLRDKVGTTNCIDNEAWTVLSTSVERIVRKFECCPNNYTILELHLTVQRKPLYYLINLVTPTSIITFISIVGFFSSPTMNDLRNEKISLGITTLLSMSILVFMVSDKMPSTSSFIPLIGWFYSSMILLITFGTLAASLVIYIQKQGIIGKRPSVRTMKWARVVNKIVRLEQPLLMKQAYAEEARQEKLRKAQMANGQRKKSMWNKFIDIAKEQKLKKLSASTDKLHKISKSGWLDPEEALHHPMRKSKSVMFEEATFSEDLSNFCHQSDDDTKFFIGPAPTTAVPQIAGGRFEKNKKERKPVQHLPKVGTSESFEGMLSNGIPHTPASPSIFRDLAQLEWDWLAALTERLFLILFIVLFLLTSVGINLMGFYMWMLARRGSPLLSN